MMGDAWIYSAVVWAIVVGAAGMAVGAYALRHVSRRTPSTTHVPALLWLIAGMTCVAMAVSLEQSRVLIYRLSYDGLIDRTAFDFVYDLTVFVAGTKVLATVAIAGSAGLKLAILRGKSDREAVRWGAKAGLLTALGWVVLSLALLAVH